MSPWAKSNAFTESTCLRQRLALETDMRAVNNTNRRLNMKTPWSFMKSWKLLLPLPLPNRKSR